MEKNILPIKKAVLIFLVFACGYFLSCLLRAITATLSPFLTSEFNLNAGKPLEIDPIIGSIIEIANKLKIETPNLKNINSRLKIKAEKMGLYKRSELIDKLTS